MSKCWVCMRVCVNKDWVFVCFCVLHWALCVFFVCVVNWCIGVYVCARARAFCLCVCDDVLCVWMCLCTSVLKWVVCVFEQLSGVCVCRRGVCA